MQQVLLCVALAQAAWGLAPDFGLFSVRATGTWSGAKTRWSGGAALQEEIADAVSISGVEGLAPFAVSSSAMPSQAAVEEVMRACGGAVQGVSEARADAGAALYLNRADDGFCYFDDGSWVAAMPDGSLEASIAHGESKRRRFSVTWDADRQLATVDSALEVNGVDSDEAISGLLQGAALDLVLDVETWQGGARVSTLVGRRPDAAAAWILPRAAWAADETQVLPGGAPLLPLFDAVDAFAVLPAMAFVATRGRSVELISLVKGECKSLMRTCDKSGLARIELKVRRAPAPPRRRRFTPPTIGHHTSRPKRRRLLGLGRRCPRGRPRPLIKTSSGSAAP
ncbi:hypothetical protein M885DRAFT_551140 [Pelagophyceae sp. CCMP2097]|nr:hypothetical protein M885DRAFT_551140 [Pelagophyceae sp. CCMP2097]